MLLHILRAACALLLLAPAVAVAAPPAEYAKRADALVRAYADAGQFTGVVLVAKDGKPILRRAYGLANREWNAAATPETRYRIGSITKQFTATAILQLAEQGKLSLDDPVSKAYAEAPAAWATVTIRHLLTHTSGIASHPSFHGPFGQDARRDWTPQALVDLSRDRPLAFEPGSRMVYNNTGFDILGLIVERLSGQPYAAYIRDHVLGPAGLAHSGYDVAAEILQRRAAGYSFENGALMNAPFISMTVAYAAGGLYSTVDDLLAWDQALHGGKVLRPASVAAMFTDQGFHYGFGQFVKVEAGRRHWGHGGGLLGFASSLDRYPDDGLTVVVLSNLEQARATRISQLLAHAWFDPKVIASGPPPGAAGLAGFAGRYRLNAAATIEVTTEAGRLYAQMNRQPKLELIREFGRTYYMTALPYQLVFAEGAKPTSITLLQGAVETVAPRE